MAGGTPRPSDLGVAPPGRLPCDDWLTHKELERRLGRKVDRKIVFLHAGDDCWSRVETYPVWVLLDAPRNTPESRGREGE